MIESCLHCHHPFTSHTGDEGEEWSTACAECECKFYWDSEDEEWWAKTHSDGSERASREVVQIQ